VTVTMNDQIKRLADAGYEVTFSQRNPHGFACDLYGRLGTATRQLALPRRDAGSRHPPGVGHRLGPIP